MASPPTLPRRLRSWARRRASLLTAVGALVTVGALAVVLAGRWGQFAKAAAGASPWLLAAAIGLQVASLLARSEAWRLCVTAAGGTMGRRCLYRAAGAGYVGNVINGELGFALRIAALRRAAPREVPRTTVLAITELPLVMIEVTLATLCSFTLVGPLGLPWWAPVIAFAAMMALTAGLARLPRHRLSGWRRGLGILQDASARRRVVVLVVIAVCGQVGRNWVLLNASGIHASLFDAMALLIATTALGALPMGPSTSTAAGVLVLGAQGVAGVSAAGVLVALTGAAGTLAYGLWAVVDRRWASRRQARRERATEKVAYRAALAPLAPGGAPP